MNFIDYVVVAWLVYLTLRKGPKGERGFTGAPGQKGEKGDKGDVIYKEVVNGKD